VRLAILQAPAELFRALESWTWPGQSARLIVAARAGHIGASMPSGSPMSVRGWRRPATAGIAGGALYDIGCYAILSERRCIFRAEPVRIVALVVRDPGVKADRLAGALVDLVRGDTRSSW